MAKAKFKVGDILSPILEETDLVKLHVLEVVIQKCNAGIEQIHYLCRVHTKQFRGSTGVFTKSLFPLNEIEVELWKPKTKGKPK